MKSEENIALIKQELSDFKIDLGSIKELLDVKVTTAKKLTVDEYQSISAILTEKLGRDIFLNKNVDPSILGGRVKTLHPKIFGGILCRRGLEQDMQQIEKYEIPEIDLVIVDLYPFEATVASGASEADIIEKIDIGGISLIRAAAKNYNDVIIVASQAQYKPLLDMLMEHGATSSLEERRWMAKEAFAVSSHYDSAIFGWFDGGEDSAFRCAAEEPKVLRYGENPHQKGVFFGDLNKMFDQIHGKEISYNNLLDINAP